MKQNTVDALNEMMRGADQQRERAQVLLDGEYDNAILAAVSAIGHALLAIDGRIAALTYAVTAEPVRVDVEGFLEVGLRGDGDPVPVRVVNR